MPRQPTGTIETVSLRDDSRAFHLRFSTDAERRPESLVRPHDPGAGRRARGAGRRPRGAGRARGVEPGARARALRPAEGARAAGGAVPRRARGVRTHARPFWSTFDGES